MVVCTNRPTQWFTNGCDATDQCTAGCERVGKRTAECGQKLVEGQQVNVKPRLVYHRECPLECIQSKRQLVTWKCDCTARKWLIINRLLIHYLKCFATILCDCSWHITVISTYFFASRFWLLFVDNKPSTKLSIKDWLLPGRYPVRIFLQLIWTTLFPHWLLQPRPGAVRVLRFSQELFDGGHRDGGGGCDLSKEKFVQLMSWTL